jgi:uncharacterized UPF0146 family protein
MKQTAVEWLVQEIETGKIEIIVHSDKIHSIRCLPELVKQVLEMEKQQIIEAYRDGRTDQQTKDGFYNRNSETYYNETYKKS